MAKRIIKKIKVGVVGCGRISQKHFQAIKKNSKFLNLVAACDTNVRVLNKLKRDYKIKVYSNFDNMINKEKLDLVSICTPSGYHAQQTIKAAQKKINVLTEKPMATYFQDGKKMVEACKKNKKKLFVVKQIRLNEPLTLLKRAIDEKRFGKIFLVQVNMFWTRPQDYYDIANWRGTKKLDGGAFMNQASHYVDLLNWLIGPIEKIHAMTDTLLRKIEVEDTGVLNIKWKKGTLGSMSITTLVYPKNYEGSITIMGEKGTVKIGGTAADQIKHWKFKSKKSYDAMVNKINNRKTKFDGHSIFYQKVIQTLLGKKNKLPKNIENLKSLETLVGIYQSASTKKTVSFPLKK